MSKDFNHCAKEGGKVVTKKIGKDRYIEICYDKKGNSFINEEVKKSKKDTGKKNNNLQKSLLKLKEHFDINYKTSEH